MQYSLWYLIGDTNLNKLQNIWSLGWALPHTFKSQNLGGRGRWISEFESSLVYRLIPELPGLHRELLS